MALRGYELMFLLDSGKFATNPEAGEATVKGMLDKIGAEVIAARPWQENKLAYEIEGHRKGLYYLTYIKVESTRLNDLNRMCQLEDLVLRHMAIVPPVQLFDVMANALLNPEAVNASEEEGAAPAAEEGQETEAVSTEEAVASEG